MREGKEGRSEERGEHLMGGGIIAMVFGFLRM